MATSGDFLLATTGDFFMAMDMPRGRVRAIRHDLPVDENDSDATQPVAMADQ